MSFTPTYFLNRIGTDELSRLLAARESFHLENVSEVDGLATSFARTFADQGLKVRIKETRMSLAQDAAVTLLPVTLGLWVFACLLYRGTVAWLRMPHPDVLIIKRRGGVEVRHKRRG